MATIDLTAETFAPTIAEEGITLVDFWADWCGPCKQFGPIYEKASEKHPDVRFAKVDTEAEQQIAALTQISAIPTLMAFRDGVLVFRESGVLPEQAIDTLIDQVAALDMDEVREKVAEAKKNQEKN